MSIQLKIPEGIYRSDIDGLRAVAVLSVVAYHAFPDYIKGGFIGVDIFFVISGYLISNIIFRNLDNKSFSLLDFYVRRIKRIFPALILVLFSFILLGWFFLLPKEYSQLGKHTVGGAGFVSNIILWMESGYFDNAADTKPFLHLWSLGVEEQFYILWPVLLILANRKINILGLGLFIAIISFCLNLEFVRFNPVADFYSPITRFWELMFGCILAWLVLYKPAVLFNKSLKNSISIFALVFFLFGLFIIDKDIGFPGKWALIPVISSTLLIFSGPNAWVNRILLSRKSLVWFGLISFPLYLWHWPLLSFARIADGDIPNIYIRLGAVGLAIIFAWLTYEFIERPIRVAEKFNVKILIALWLIILLLGYTIFYFEGLPYRFIDREKTVEIHSWLENHKEYSVNCSNAFHDQSNFISGCLFQKNIGENSIALIGDSHAGQLFPGLVDFLQQEKGVALFNFACQPPLWNISINSSSNPNIKQENYRLMNQAIEYISKDPKIDTVILASHPKCTKNNAIDRENLSNVDSKLVLASGLRRTLAIFQKTHKSVIIVVDNPYLPYDPSSCVHRPLLLKKSAECSFQREIYDLDPAVNEYREIVNLIVRDFQNVQVVDLSDKLCDKVKCYSSNGGAQFYSDRGHLNVNGSRYVAPLIIDKIKTPE